MEDDGRLRVVDSAAMYCPDCKAEYRPGFTRCADCDVDLVAELTADPEDEAEKDPFCQFWKGEDPRVFAELCDILAGESIPHKTAELQEHAFNLKRFPEFRLAVPFSRFEQAEQVVAEAYGSADAADNAMYPTLENREGYRELISWPREKKWEGRDASESNDDEEEPDDREAKEI